MIELVFENDGQIFFYTNDNRELAMRVSKYIDGEPAIDLLPRVRYKIKYRSICEKTTKELMLTFGLNIIRIDDVLAMVVNTSDIIVRFSNTGKCMCDG
jgi:hypothetical protein